MNQFNQIFDFLYDVLHDRDSNYDQTLASARMTPVVTLYVLSVITFPHESFTRYPGPEMSPSDYTKQLGIVKEALKIVKILECEQRKIKKL